MAEKTKEPGDYDEIFQRIQKNTIRVNQLCNELESMKSIIGQKVKNQSAFALLAKKENESTKLAKETVETINRLLKNIIPSPSARQRIEALQTNFQRTFERLRRVQAEIQMRMREANNKAAELQASRNPFEGQADDETQLLAMQQDQERELAITMQEEEEMHKIEQDVIQIHSMVSQMAEMVQQQSQMVDDIDAHIESAYDHTVEGNQQLNTAVRSADSRRKKCCILWAVLTVVLIVVLGIIIYQFVGHRS